MRRQPHNNMWPIAIIIIAVLLFLMWFLNWLEGNSSSDEAYSLLLVATHLAAMGAGVLFSLAAIKIAFGSIAAYAQRDAQTDRYRNLTYRALAGVEREYQKGQNMQTQWSREQWKADQQSQPQQQGQLQQGYAQPQLPPPSSDQPDWMVLDADEGDFTWQD